MSIILDPLEKAIDLLTRAVVRSRKDTKDEELRDAVIQRFEYTYELSWKMLKRVLETELPNPADADRMSFPELVREGAERGMIANVEAWLEYREQRNITSHTYDQDKANSVYASALDFLKDARELFQKLAQRNT